MRFHRLELRELPFHVFRRVDQEADVGFGQHRRVEESIQLVAGLVDSTDFLPTIVEAAGLRWPADRVIDGRSFLPQLRGELEKALHQAQELQAKQDDMSWTMSFLYRTAELAPTGKDGSVVVSDRPQLEVLSVGMNGPYGTGVVEKGLGLLHDWLKAHPEYEIAGDPSAFHYNGPYISNRNKWSEVQLPVRKKA